MNLNCKGGKGDIYAIPNDEGTYALYYNKAVLQAAGVDVATVKDWPSLTAAWQAAWQVGDGAPPNGALIITTERNTSGRVNAHQPATGDPLQIIERAGHNPHSEQPAQVMQAVRDFICADAAAG